MAEAKTNPLTYDSASASASVTVYPLQSNKRPVGFAPWPKTKKRKKGKRA